jgi:hypothetical protein
MHVDDPPPRSGPHAWELTAPFLLSDGVAGHSLTSNDICCDFFAVKFDKKQSLSGLKLNIVSYYLSPAALSNAVVIRRRLQSSVSMIQRMRGRDLTWQALTGTHQRCEDKERIRNGIDVDIVSWFQ